MAEENVPRIPAVSPCRRDYQLRSLSSPTSKRDSSRSKSPWLPRSRSQQRAEEVMSPFRLHESSAGAAPIGRLNARSGPLPVTSRSHGHSCGSPLPIPSPLPSYFSGTAVPGSGSPTKSRHQSSSFAQRLPSVSGENGGLKAADVPYTLRSTTVRASPKNLRRRNCSSGDLGLGLGRSCEVARARKCKSSEIVGLEIRGDGIFPISESRKEEERTDGVLKHPSPGSIVWEALNDADNESPRRELPSTVNVPVPFKWEGAASASGKVSDSCLSETGDAKLVVTSPSPDVETLAVPFKWEVMPGKPKLEEKANVDASPALQLPPRLVSASSMKRYSWGSSPPPFRASSLNASLSSSVSKLSSSVGKQLSYGSMDESPSLSTPRALRPRAFSGALSQFGTPQYQCADYSFCEDSSSHPVRSPTSTLYGPGTPSSSSSGSHSRKPTHSVESFDLWSCGDHTTSTSRHSHTESQSEDFVRGHEDVDQVDGAIVKLRKKLSLKAVKPPKSPKTTPSRNGYSFQGEEYFDCRAHVSSPALVPSDTEEEVVPAMRLPYKMPSPVHDVELSSPTRVVSVFANCLALPRFLTKGESSQCQWVANSSWNAPRDAPENSDMEDGYRSPAYKATVEMFSPSPGLLAKRGLKLRSPSSRRRHPHLLEVLCNTIKQSLQRCTKRSVARTHSIALYDDQFTRRHQSFMW